MTDHRMDILGELPQEIAEMIFEYLRAEDLFNCYNVSNRWQQKVNHERVWSKKLSYHKYVEKFWEDELAEGYGEGLINRFISEMRIKNNMKSGNYTLVTDVHCNWLEQNLTLFQKNVWSTLTDGLLLSNGESLIIRDSPNFDLFDVDITLSTNLRLLAVPCKNFLFIYERVPTTTEFVLLSLLAVRPATEEEHSGPAMLSLVSCPKLDQESVGSFMKQHKSKDGLHCFFFTGVDFPNERRAFLELIPDFFLHPYQYVLWDVDRNRIEHGWTSNSKCDVVEGWDRRGICITYDTDGGRHNRIEYFDLDMRPLTVIPLNGRSVHRLVISYNFSVADIKSNEGEQLVMWEKDSTEYRVLVEDFTGRIINVGPSTVAYQLDKETVAIMVAPDWEMLARVKIDLYSYIDDFKVTEFSDGSLFVVTHSIRGYVWHDIDRRLTEEICEWATARGRRLKLPEYSISPLDTIIEFNKGLRLVVVTEKDPQSVISIIDYDK